MELKLLLSDPVEIRLAVEFMGKIAVHRDQEGCFMATSATRAASEMAEAVVTKAAERPDHADVVVPKSDSAESGLKPADIQPIASEKSGKVGVERVKEVIASFGGKTIKDVEPSRYLELKAALEAL